MQSGKTRKVNDINEGKVLQAVKKMTNGKYVGLDGIVIDF